MSKKASVIIPTLGRKEDILRRTIQSILNLTEIKNQNVIVEIFIIDQNYPSLDLKEFAGKLQYIKEYSDPNFIKKDFSENKLIHFYGLAPSVTKAKNFALNFISGDYMIFFDDDVEVMDNCIANYIALLDSNPKIGFLGGREIVPDIKAQRSKWKTKILELLFKLSSHDQDKEYIYQQNYIGRIKPNSIMHWHFDNISPELIKIDSARGCNWATTAKVLTPELRFDQFFKGSALREESDLYLRIISKGFLGFFTSHSTVIHYRQGGGCGNLLSDTTSFISKLENEQYFQRKHFAKVSRLYFFIRMMPLTVEYFKSSWGTSLILLIKATIQL